MKEKRTKLKDRILSNDIRFSGVLSYRHIRIIAWFFLIVSQIAVVMRMNVAIKPESSAQLNTWINVLSFFSNFPLPLFLLANLSVILRKRNSYKQLLLYYGGLALLIYFFANFVVFHYGFRSILAVNSNATWATAARVFGTLLPLMKGNAYNINIFIDLFLCALIFFFLNYRPVKHFRDKNIIWFRLMVIIPILYEIGTIVIKYQVSIELYNIPSYVFFLLPSKPVFTFVAVLIIMLIFKIGERQFNKRHKEDISFEEHLLTKAHSLKMSIIIAVVFLIIGVLDLITYLVISSSMSKLIADEAALSQQLFAIDKIGVGNALSLIFITPLIMLFSYSKEHKNTLVDKIIPAVGIALLIFVYVEGTFEITVNGLESFLNVINSYIDGQGEQEENSASFVNILLQINQQIRSIL